MPTVEHSEDLVHIAPPDGPPFTLTADEAVMFAGATTSAAVRAKVRAAVAVAAAGSPQP